MRFATPRTARSIAALICLFACGDDGARSDAPFPERDDLVVPDLPRPVTNNAVASVIVNGRAVAISALGVDSTKRWEGLTRAALRWDAGDTAWRAIAPAPGPPRIAATAQGVRGRIYVFGGYTVAEDGAERSVPDVAIYDPAGDAWREGAPIPIPVDDAVSGVWRDSLVYLVSGWHDDDNETAVQIYDPARDEWSAATPIPGPPVFGHTGGVVGDAIVYVDGTRIDLDPRTFRLERSSWLGAIDPSDPDRIEWSRLPDHPGPAIYRGAALGFDGRVFFAGGSDNTYNYDGIGYDGAPAEPAGVAFAWDVSAAAWTTLPGGSPPTMDHRGLIELGGRLYTIGGMTRGQRVTARVIPLSP
ncbi:MAG: galactose oxidase [Gemmatimonadota bacterium]|nr:galactose oxidase [Gemmatimonadota bacterium]